MYSKIAPSRRVRSTPFTPRVEAAGVTAYSVYNRMLIPAAFEGTEADYLHLREHVQLWDVSCERQVEVRGKDAMRLAQMSTPRDLRGAQPGQCLYAPMTDAHGRMINDPVLLVHSGEHLWLSLADSDAIWWCRGIAAGFDLDVEICEPNVNPLAIQGPMADGLAARVFGEKVRDLKFFRFAKFEFQGHPLVVARSGWSKQGGFEVYVDSDEVALPLWDALMGAGGDLHVRAGNPNPIERIEGGLLSYGNDMTDEDTPLDCSLDKYCHLNRDFDFLGKQALVRYANSGKARRILGLRLRCGRGHAPALTRAWPVSANGAAAGKVTSAAFSPRFGCLVALAMLENGVQAGDEVRVAFEDGRDAHASVTNLPMAE